MLALLTMIATAIPSTDIHAQSADTLQVDTTIYDVVPVTPAVETPTERTFIGTENLLDSAQSILKIVHDPAIEKVVTDLIAASEAKVDPETDGWLGKLDGIWVAVAALVTLLLAKGKALYKALTKTG